MNKRGQFFLFAAIVISAIIISLMTTANKVKSTPEPQEFRTTAKEIKQESGKVIEYEIFKYQTKKELNNFIDQLSKYLKDKDPDANFLFIYGNLDELTIENYASSKVKASVGQCQKTGLSQGTCQQKFILGGGKKITSTINLGPFNSKTQDWLYNKRGYKETFKNIQKDADIEIEIEGYKHNFKITKNKQLIFILQKTRKDENFVEIQ